MKTTCFPLVAAFPYSAQLQGMVFLAVLLAVIWLAGHVFSGSVQKLRGALCGLLHKISEKCCGANQPVVSRKQKLWNEDALAIGTVWVIFITIGWVLVGLAVHAMAGGGAAIVKVGEDPYMVQAAAPGAIYTATLWAFGCLVVGAFLGFLFGVPHVVQSADAPAAAAGDRKNRAAVIRYNANTSLEQVADWLTKMVVGVSLVELRKAPEYLSQASAAMSANYGNAPESKAFGIAVIVYFSVVGFLGSYLMTKLYLQAALLRSDSSTLGNASEKANLSNEQVIALKNATLGFSERERALSGVAADAGAKLLDEVGFDELESAQDYALWGKASIGAGRYDDAVKAYATAADLAPADVTIKLEYATALYLQERVRRRKAGQDEIPNAKASPEEKKIRKEAAIRIRPQLQAAYRGMDLNTSSDTRRNIVKNLTYVYLYPDETDSDFEKAIFFGEEYVQDPHHLPSGGLHVNLACAYGQKAASIIASLNAADVTAEEKKRRLTILEGVRVRSIFHAREALKIDSAWKCRLRQLLEKDSSGKDTDDNDLESFESDPEYRDLLDLAPLPAGHGRGVTVTEVFAASVTVRSEEPDDREQVDPKVEAPPKKEAAPVVISEPKVEAPPKEEAAPVVTPEPKVEAPPKEEAAPVVTPEPVVEAPPKEEAAPVVTPEPVVEAPPKEEAAPVVTPEPVVEAPPKEEAKPAVEKPGKKDAKPAVTPPPAPQEPIKGEDGGPN